MALFWNLKYRFLTAGVIVAIIGLILLIIRPGFIVSYVLIIVGIIVFVVGLFWKREKKTDNTSTN